MEGPVVEIAPVLLGGTLTHGGVTVRLTEVEAYDGPDDPASHAYRGTTARNAVMFGPPGRLYVYFSYGMHWCANVVCGPDGRASAVLLRAGEVIEGHRTARQRRGGRADIELARGPANLTQALGIQRHQDGLDLAEHLTLPTTPVAAAEVASGPRVGVSQAADVPWRFWLRGDPTVSAYKRSPRAPHE
ncbi:MAG: DNA-3-methyladenine glycosylase [Nocardioides sp.]